MKEAYQRYMDDLALFGDDAAALVDARDQMATWLESERGLALRDPRRCPQRASGRHRYLGYLVSASGIEPGPRMRRRVREVVTRQVRDPDALEHAVSSLGAAWMFG